MERRTDELIRRINSDEKLRRGEKVYRDEPIIMTASGMKNYTPEKITRMMNISRTPEARYKSVNWLFYHQGKFMEGYTDTMPFNDDLTVYYPTYSSLNIKQLRGYFTWRTSVINGEYPDTQLSFIFLYIYELICNIGVSSAENGFERLVAVRENYRGRYPNILLYIKKWLADYVIYYGLGKEYLEQVMDMDSENAVITLMEYKESSDEAIAKAIIKLSSYSVERSPFYKEHTEDYERVLSAVFRRLCLHHEKRSRKTYTELLFGTLSEYEYNLFAAAVFYDWRKYDEYDYEVSPITSYSCRNGRWKCRKYLSTGDDSKKLGILCKGIDSIMRGLYGTGKPILHNIDKKYILSMIEEETEKLLIEKKKAEERKIKIDVSKLGGIRAAADITRDKLMTESEMAEDMIPGSPAVITEDEQTETAAVHDEPVPDDTDIGLLSPAEYKVIQRLLYGGDVNAAAREIGTPLSVTADSINEKLFDMFGDTVIIFEGDVPCLIEDYTDELKGIIKE